MEEVIVMFAVISISSQNKALTGIYFLGQTFSHKHAIKMCGWDTAVQ